MSKYAFQYEMKSEYYLPEILDAFQNFIENIATQIPFMESIKQDPIEERNFLYYRSVGLVEQAIGYRKKVAYYSYVSVLQLILIRYFQFKKMSIARMQESQIFASKNLVIDTFQNIFGMEILVQDAELENLDTLVKSVALPEPSQPQSKHQVPSVVNGNSYAAKHIWNAFAINPTIVVSYEINTHPYMEEILRSFAKVVEHFDQKAKSNQ